MRRRHLVATATAGALTSILSTLMVAMVPLLADRPAAAADARHSSVSQALGSVAVFQARQPRAVPLVIAHRGASAYRPEHTIEAYRLAIEQGADFIEADLVMTKDGEMIARHEHELAATTDVQARPEFASKRRTKLVNGAPVTGWFTEDFTLAELRSLHARTRKVRAAPSASASSSAAPSASAPAAQPLAIPTLQDVIDLLKVERSVKKRQVGLYVELKLPGYFTSIGLAPEPRLADILKRNGLGARTSPVFVESFEVDSLRTLHGLTDVPLVQLTWAPAELDDPAARNEWLAVTRGYAHGIGLPKERLLPGSLAADDLVRTAHRLGLEVHVFTFGNAPLDYPAYFGMGVDGVFTDNPDIAIAGRKRP